MTTLIFRRNLYNLTLHFAEEKISFKADDRIIVVTVNKCKLTT